MSLSSQSPRSTVLGTNSSRRGRLGRLPAIGVLLALGVAVVFFFWPNGDGDGVESLSSNTADEHATHNASPPPPDAPPPSLTLGGITPARTTTNPTPSTPPDRPEVQSQPTPPEAAPAPEAATPPEVTPAPEVVGPVKQMTESLPPPKPFSSGGGADATKLYNHGDALLADNKLVEGRAMLSRLLFAPDAKLSDTDANVIRNRLTEVNQRLFWSSEIFENDPLAKPYKVDNMLGPIAVKHRVPYQLLELVNQVKAERLQADKTIKVIQGPLHARVTKHQFLMDIYGLDATGQPVYICSFPVGLGKDDKTPLGRWQVVAGSKTANPSWRDDQSGEFFAADNPDNPIGEFWIAIRGLDESNKNKQGFGIHGTIEPDTIGQEASRGCIRLNNDDIKLVFSMLTDHSQGSTVTVVP